MSDVASVEEIRRRFPALRRVHGGAPVAYFDGPGGTQVPQEVADAVADYLLHHNANTHWAYPTSEETDAALQRAREALADFVGGRADEIAFGANMTTLTFHVARALGRRFRAGDELVVTELDHHANVDPWKDVARERGLTVRVARANAQTGMLDVEHALSLLGPRTRLLAVGAASNALGTVNDVARLTAAAHHVGALAYVDAVHYAAHQRIDVGALGADLLASSAYKYYGPHVGVLWARRHLMEALDVPKLQPAGNAAPERVETGTLCHEGIVGAGAAVDFLASLAPGGSRPDRLTAAMSALHERSMVLFERLWRGLGAVPGVRLLGRPPGEGRTSTLAFAVAGHDPEAVARALAARGVFVTHGDFYATTIVERLGYAGSGVLRAGIVAYTTADEIDRLVDGVAALTRTT